MTGWSHDPVDTTMPTDTFFNLPDEKRELICAVAVEEFSEFSFDQASINRIVANAGIAKGSFYQYFQDKKDLFFYILRRIGEEKMKFLAPTWENLAGKDLFTSLRELTVAGIKFAHQHPQYSEIGNWIVANRSTEIFNEIMEDNTDTMNIYFGALVKKAIARGEIRADIQPEMLSQIIASMYLSAVDLPPEFAEREFDESMLATVDAFLEVLKNGIGMKEIPA
jgi:AcrR family transcriptional regulator